MAVQRQAWLVIAVLCCFAARGAAEEPAKKEGDKAKPAPIKALLITGGCCHDYEKQKVILTEGISARANVEWTIVHEGGNGTKHQVSIYKDANWGKPYDIVVHNECFADEKDLAHIALITEAHKAGLPAVVIHCAVHCYRGDTQEWFKFIGVRSHRHGAQLPILVENAAKDDPIMKAFPGEWKTINEELYEIAEVFPTCKPLATGVQGDGKKNVCIWTNQFGKGKVFGTTIAHNNETMADKQYLDVVTRGLLWAVDKLDDDGKPKAGYEGAGAAAKTAAPADKAADEANAPKPTPAGWSESQVSKLPSSEKPIYLFNGKDFDGWEGHVDTYWSIADGVIIAKNTAENAPKVSTYLITKGKYRNFRLIFEGKLVTSEMHSGVAIWGKQFESGGEKISYQGHLVMFPSDYGFWDLFRRNSIYKDNGAAKKAGKQHDWNQMEILAIGARIRFVVNGQQVADWTDNKPELCQEGPLGLQLHSNKNPQEVHFRGLILTENPEDKVVTAEEKAPAK